MDVGEGWLIFGLPPAEVAVHPGEENDVHELYLMCDDVAGFVASMSRQGVGCGPVLNRGWGLLTQVRLPGGGHLGVYQPRHGRPRSVIVTSKPKASAGRKTSARRKTAPGGGKPRPKKAARRRPSAGSTRRKR